MTDKPKPRTVKVPHPSYQPTAKELREDLRTQNGTFEDAITALVRQVIPSKPK